MTGPINNQPELRKLIRALVEYGAGAGRQVTFVWPAKNDLAHCTIIYTLHPIKPEFETNEPVLQAKDRHIFLHGSPPSL
jgi:hypothetical protein